MVLSEITGSRAYERYTGPQIRKLFTTEADLYASTERISLVSSFMASLLIGDYASIDETDGAGMNLMDIKKRCWSKEALQVCFGFDFGFGFGFETLKNAFFFFLLCRRQLRVWRKSLGS